MENLLTEQEAADRLGIHVDTLAAWRRDTSGNTPTVPHIKLGKRAVRYLENDVAKFVKRNRTVR